MPLTLQALIAAAIARHGVAEVARRLELEAETCLRLATPGAVVRKGSRALAEKNAHRLSVESTEDAHAGGHDRDGAETSGTPAIGLSSLLRRAHGVHDA